MEARGFRSFLVIIFVLSNFITACRPTTLSQPPASLAPVDTLAPTLASTATLPLLLSPNGIPETTIAETRISSPSATPVRPSAQDLALAVADLGDGWLLTGEKADLDDSYCFARDENGNGIIGTHRTTHTPMFEPAWVETISMRAFSLQDQSLILGHFMAIFKEAEQAAEAVKRFFPRGAGEGELPSESTNEDGERYTYRYALVGDESVVESGWITPDGKIPVVTSLYFRQGRVLVGLVSVGEWDYESNSPDINIPALSEERLVELAQMIAARLP